MIRYYTAAEIAQIVVRTCDNDRDPGACVNRPGAWPTQGVDMQNDSGRASSRRNPYIPDMRPSHWQDPVAERVLGAVDRGDEVYPLVLQEIIKLKRSNVEVTVAVAEEVIERCVERIRARPLNVPESLPTTRSRRGRFSTVSITGPVVYYMRIGNRVKIGYSTNLIERLNAINPEELLAAESGSPEVERRRHRQFGQYRTHGEWFRLEGKLAEHIERLRQVE
jgi:hypothetical protein